jgi:uncharacterized protein YjbI with pentapeptide repeats
MDQDEQQTPGQRALELIRVLLPNWKPTTQDVLRWIRVAIIVGIVILGVLLILDVVSSIFGIKLYNLLQILAVPITVGAAVPWLNWLQKKREQDVEEQRAQDEALQAYLDYLSERILKDDLRDAVEGTGLRRLTRARTLTVLERLGPKSKGRVMQILAEVELIQRKLPEGAREKGPSYKAFKNEAVVSLRGADLSGAYLRRANLYAVGLLNVDLSNADLSSAKLIAAKLRNANLSGANLSGANLSRADLSRANLSGANLSGADLSDAELSDADLSGAYELNNAGAKQSITNEELEQQAGSLAGATMPNGQKYEDWLKSRGEDGDAGSP